MTERPIPFSAPMVRAILDGTKTQTRRAVKGHPGDAWLHDGFGRITSKHPKQGRFGLFVRRGIGTDFPECDIVPCPYGQPGDRLWVREAWKAHTTFDHLPPRDIPQSHVWYMADQGYKAESRYRQGMHMPRWASRIILEVTGVRVERVQDISEADARAEGAQPLDPHWPIPADGRGTHASGYRSLWEQINGPDSWASNPWVWVVEFRRIS